MRHLTILATILAALSGPVLAQEQAPAPRLFSLPQGCTAFVTIQMTSCTVSHHFTCAGDPEGLQRRVDMDEGGVTYFGATDAETQWIESTHVMSGHSEALEPAPADRASFTELLATGTDTFDFQTLSAEIGTTRYVGRDTLPGETVTIDGVQLDRTEYQITAYAEDGTEVWSGTGREYISREWRIFVSGMSTTTAGGETWESDNTPVEFIFPDEPGFLSGSPKHGCGVLLSSVPLWPGLDSPA